MAEVGCRGNKISNSEPLGVGNIEEGRNSGHFIHAESMYSLTEAPSEIMADGENGDIHVVDIDKWAGSLASILEDIPEYMCNPGHLGRITRIPQNLREVDTKAYEPCFLSIGPYHHGKERVQKMERRKLMVLKLVLQARPELTLKHFLEEIRSIEREARSFYSAVDIGSEKFIKMLLLDSLYIITVFCDLPRSQDIDQTNTVIGARAEDPMKKEDEINGAIEAGYDSEETLMMTATDEPIDGTSAINNMPRWFWILLLHDLFLTENQLPLFVLQRIYAISYGGPETQLLDIMKDRVGNMLLNYTNLNSDMKISSTEEVHHILHLCHMFFCPTLKPASKACQLSESGQMFRLGNAVQLYETGVSFETRSASTKHCLIDITFSSGKMVMPSLNVDDNTLSLLRNLIALEQMKYPRLGLNVSAYAVILLHLITIPEDVKLLRRKGIIEHHLASDKEMVYVINRLSVGLAFDYVEDDYSLKPVFQELKSYTERKSPRWRAWLKQRYFHNPWTVIPLLAASFLLLLTFVQSFYTVYSYYYPCFKCHL